MRHHKTLAIALKFPTTIYKCILFSLFIYLSACASLATHGLAEGISNSIQNQNDKAIVAAGMPAFLLMVDGMILDNPRDSTLLMAGARLYSAYATVFASDEEHSRLHADKAFKYARRAVCLEISSLCSEEARKYDHFVALINGIDKKNKLPVLYTYASAWATWIQVNSGQWQSLANLPRVETILQRVIELDDGYEYGFPHVYLGVINSQLPATLGGRPEVGRQHFERAIELSMGKNLIAKTEYAHTYARLLFKQKLHDKLLNEVLAADPEIEGLTLSNVIAQEQARILLEDSKDYFEE